MLDKKRSLQAMALILCLGSIFTVTQEASEYTLHFERHKVVHKTPERDDLSEASSHTLLLNDERLLLSEAFGHYVGRNLNNPGLEFDLETFIKGVRDGAQGTPPPISDAEYKNLMEFYKESAYAEIAELNLQDAEAFLKDNLHNNTVIEVETGKVQCEILRKGKGDAVLSTASPLIHFTGKLLDGTIFETTKDTGLPAAIPLEYTMAGFQKGIEGMREGEIRRLYIHPDYGYGVTGHLPPNTLLIFDVEVIKARNPVATETPVTLRDDAIAPEVEVQMGEGAPETWQMRTPASAEKLADPEDENPKNHADKMISSAYPLDEVEEEDIHLRSSEFKGFEILDEEFELPNW